MKTLITNARVMQNAESEIVKSDIIITDNIVTFIGKNAEKLEQFDKIIDAKNNLIMPGFINCHAHSAMTILKGVGEGKNLEEWLFDNVIKVEENLSEEDVYWATKLSVLEYLKNGITTVNDMYYYHTMQSAKAFYESGFRAVINIDEKEISKNEEYFKECEKYKNLIVPAFSCHSVYNAGEKRFSEKISLAKKFGAVISTHMSETLTEVGNCDKEFNQTPTQLLESYGFFDNKSLVYHAVHLDKKDIEILNNYNVSVCSCPASNLKLGSGIAPINSLINKGINVCLGTDGSSSNNKLDMFREMYLLSCLQKEQMRDSSVLSPEITLKIATTNGAKSLGLNKIGELKVGNFADLIMVNLNSVNNSTSVNIKSNLVYASGCEDVLLTMINGKVLYENGNYYIDKSVQDIIKNCNKSIKKLGVK